MRAVAILVMSGLFGCGRLDFDGGTGVHITVESSPPLELAELHVQLAFANVDPDALHAMATALPAQLDIGLPDAGMCGATATARDSQGRVFTATGQAMVFLNQESEVTLTLGATLAPTCFDGVIDGSETGVDCGGTCPACGIGGACVLASDCTTNQCVVGACEPAAGPPSWVPAAPIPTARIGLAAVLGGNGHIYAIGGSINNDMVAVDEVDIYDAATDTWSVGPSIATKRIRTSGAIDAAGNIYVIGGGTVGNGGLTSVERLAPGATQWTSAPSLLQGRLEAAAATGPDGTVFEIGGYFSSANIAEVEALGATWVTRAPLPAARGNLASTIMKDGRIAAIGGHDVAPIVYHTTADAYDTVANTWTALPDLNHARSDLSAVTAPDGRTYAIGGYAGSGGLTFVEAYRGGSTWLDLPPTAIGRDACAATLGPDGRIYVIGGRALVADGASVEVYGPHMTLDTMTGAVGTLIAVTGDNFATSAAVEIRFDGVAIEAASTTAAGAMTATFVVPKAAAGTHVVEIEDARSAYPVHAAFTIP